MENTNQALGIIATLRQYRIGPFAIFDFAASYLVVYFVAPYLTRLFALVGIHITRAEWLALTLPIALATHLAFSVETPLTKMFLGGNFWAVAVIVVMVIFGLKGAVAGLF